MQITRVICPEYKYATKCPDITEKEGIAIHNTANDASAMSEISYMIGRPEKVSFHVAVDDYRVVEGLDFNRSCYATGDGRYGRGNAHMISIEICYSKSGGERFDQAERLCAEYVAYLLKQYGWGIDKVTKHQDYSGKYCPHRTLDYGWDRFLNMIKSHLDGQVLVSNGTKKIVYNVSTRLNIRNCPGGTIVGKLLPNQEVTVYEENNGWSRIGDIQWVSSNYLKDINTSEQPVNTSKYVLGKYVVSTANRLNVRNGAGTNGTIVLKTYSKGTRFDTYEIKGNWARTPSGWVCLDYCSLVNAY